MESQHCPALSFKKALLKTGSAKSWELPMSYFMYSTMLGESNMAASARATKLTVSFLPFSALTLKSIVGKKATLDNTGLFLYAMPSHSAIPHTKLDHFTVILYVCIFVHLVLFVWKSECSDGEAWLFLSDCLWARRWKRVCYTKT